jgi:hypothetical protein
MKNFLLLLFIFTLVASQKSFAQTPVSGGIYANTTWTLANSPYLITGPIVVFPSKTLTIEPGVKIKVQADIDLSTGISKNYLEIRGNLVAVGTQNAPIIFTTDSINGSNPIPAYPFTPYVQWYGIVIKSLQGATADINYLTIDHSSYGIDNQNPALTDSISLKGCTFSNNGFAFGLSGPVTLDSCFFINNQYCFKGSSQHALNAINCKFYDNKLCIYNFGLATNLTNCLFENNAYAISATAGGLITDCVFNNNEYVFFDYNANNYTISNSSFTNNITAINLMEYSSITNCQFTDNGLAIGLGEGMLVQNCNISNNQIGIKTWGEFVPGQVIMEVKDNQICNNSLYNVENATDLNLGLEKNCFCSTDSTVIENLIYDGYDDITRGLYNYAIYDSTCQNIISYVTKVDFGLISTVEEKTLASFSLFPNPSTSEISIQTSNPAMFNSALQILDMNGRLVKSNLSYIGNSAIINIDDLQSGVYILMEETSLARKMFVKQ